MVFALKSDMVDAKNCFWNQKIGKCEKNGIFLYAGRSLQHNWITLILGYTPNYIISGCILSHSLKMVHVHTVKAGSLSRLNSTPLEHKTPQTDAFWVNNSACCWCFARRTIENCLPSLLPFPVNIWHYAWIASIVLVLGWLVLITILKRINWQIVLEPVGFEPPGVINQTNPRD